MRFPNCNNFKIIFFSCSGLRSLVCFLFILLVDIWEDTLDRREAHRNTEQRNITQKNVDIYHSVPAVRDRKRLRPRGHCDRPVL